MPFSSEQIIFLINPNSGQEKHEKILTALQTIDSSISYFICNNNTELVQFFASLNKEIKVVVICGGDGTVNSILKYAVNSNLVFAVLPTGSGNGFAREMEYPKRIDKLLAIIKRGKIKEIDVFKVNNNYCINVAGIGFDGFIAHQFDKNGKRGLVTYVIETLKGFFKYKDFNATVIADDNQLEGNYFMLAMANTQQFGNNIIIAPNALPNDGLIDLVVFKKFPKIALPQIVFKWLGKKGKNSKYIQYFRARKVVIKTNYELYHIDGEPQINTSPKLSASIYATIKVIDAEN